MSPYPKYATTVIGAHSVPDWYEPLDRLISFGQLSMSAMLDAQFRATEGAVLDQELAGIDVVTGGEMHRRTHNRHAPPNAMLNHFWQRIPAFQGSTRPKPITSQDPNVFHPAATCRARIQDTADLGLVEEFQTVSGLTKRPVKITMTGPHMLAKVAYDEHYNNIKPKMMAISANCCVSTLRGSLRRGASTSRSTSRCSRCRTKAKCKRRSMRSMLRSKACRATSTSRPTSAKAITLSGRNMTRRSAIVISTLGGTRRNWSARSNARPISSSTTWRTITKDCWRTASWV